MSDYLKELFIDEAKAALKEINGVDGTGENAEIFNDYANNIASGEYSHAEGFATNAIGMFSHTEGYKTKASGQAAHAEGWSTHAFNPGAHAEGENTSAERGGAHAEGSYSEAIGSASHSEGSYSIASGDYSHAEGDHTIAKGKYSHTQGSYTIATHPGQQIIGSYNIPDNYVSITITGQEWFGNSTTYFTSTETPIFNAETGLYTYISRTGTLGRKLQEGDIVLVQDSYWTLSGNNCSSYFVIGTATGQTDRTKGKLINVDKYTTSLLEYHKTSHAHIVGNGTSDIERSNAHTLDWKGNAWFAGTIEGDGVIIPSSTEGSTKKFRITVDDSGTITATEVNY